MGISDSGGAARSTSLGRREQAATIGSIAAQAEAFPPVQTSGEPPLPRRSQRQLVLDHTPLPA
jgi:hypothetical protein